jgi:universal stress protein A
MPEIFRRILCPVDFDENSMAAVDLACVIAAQNGAQLYLMHVDPFPIGATEIMLPSEPIPAWEEGSKLKLEKIAEERIPEAIASETVTRSGVPAEQIVRAVVELNIDLVVMATHGRERSAIGHFLLGSVAERVVRESPCPVLAVPPR